MARPLADSGAMEAMRQRALRFRREADGERGFSLASLGKPFQMPPMLLIGRRDAGRRLGEAEEAKHGCDRDVGLS